MRIYVSGSLAFDRIMSFPGKFSDHILPDKIHILNVCFMVDGLEEKFGGTAGNIAYSLALLDERPLILATAGKDFERYEKWLRSQELSLEGIHYVEDEFTAGAYITTDLSDNQITGFNPGAMKHPSQYPYDRMAPVESLAIVSPGNLQDMQDYPQTYRELKIPFIIDPGQSITAFSGTQLAEMIRGSAYLVSNDYELEMIMSATSLDRSQLLKLTGVIITTLGEKGAVIVEPGQETKIPAVKVKKVVDPTGAGDAFRAGLIKGLVLGKSLVEAVQVGSTCASFSVENLGTQEHQFVLHDFWARYQEHY